MQAELLKETWVKSDTASTTPGVGRAGWGSRTIFHTVFIGNLLYVDKPHSFFQIMADCTVPLTPGQSRGFVQEFIHVGCLGERPPHFIIVTGGPNAFPD